VATFAENYVDVLMRAWKAELDFTQLIDCANQMEARQLSPLAVVLYQTWLARNTSPYSYAAYFNLGVTLSNVQDLEGALAAYRQALVLHPAFVQPRLNMGSTFERQGKIAEALAEWKWVCDHVAPDSPENKSFVVMAYNHRGRVQESQKQMEEALECLTQSLAVDPEQPDALHHWVHLRQKMCIWPTYTALPGVSVEAMRAATSALAMISASDDPAEQLAAAKRFVAKKVRSDVPQLANPKGYGHKKIRIAYVSSDFSNHPVSMLTAELFELHDRSQFEVFAFCWSPEDRSPLRARVMKAMDHFIRIAHLGDEDAAKLIREHEIDILIDLQGQTAGARTNMLAYRPAPIQITYLGLPATTGLPSIDYVIADRFLIPEDLAQYYSEKPLYMPEIYQCSDRKRLIGAAPSRSSCGLPEVGVIFCSLNNNYKFTPEVFEVWMRILLRTPGSFLWLLSDNPWAENNLRREAAARGISAERVIFAPRVAPENYLARYALADLFLDTFPFNAGTTANDALWMGLPVLTYTGRPFASRMAGALLTAAGMPELITYNLADYEEKAVQIANNPGEIQRLKAQLQTVHSQGVLFDTPRFAAQLELKLQALVSGF
jgi:predicted O-linked N-acetylglucosamine transferase (SPINDLY family)